MTNDSIAIISTVGTNSLNNVCQGAGLARGLPGASSTELDDLRKRAILADLVA